MWYSVRTVCVLVKQSLVDEVQLFGSLRIRNELGCFER